MLNLMSSHHKRQRKGICFDISGVIMEKLINDETPKEDPPSSSKD